MVVSYLLVILVHEAGHYAAGILVGVPRSAMRIVLRGSPHVALRGDDGRWLAPAKPGVRAGLPALRERPAPRVQRTSPEGPAAETAFVAVVGALGLAAGRPGPVLAVAGVSLAIHVPYVVHDLVLTAREGRPRGDASAL